VSRAATLLPHTAMNQLLPHSAAALAALLLLGPARPAQAAGGAPAASRPALGLDASPALKPAKAGSAKVGPEGFINRWLLLDPIAGDGRVTESAVRAAAQKEYFPGQQTAVPHVGETVKVGEAELTWRAIEAQKHNVNLYHFAFYQGKPTTNQVFWGVTIVESPEDIPNVRLAVGSNSGSVWWLNGEEKVALYGDIQTFIDDTASKKFTLKKGRNVLRFIVVNNAGMVDCTARFLDAEGRPITTLTTVLPEK
jgi:hypothetical protein